MDRTPLDKADPKGLIRESFRIEGITTGECRSILTDWALSLGATVEPRAALPILLAHYSRHREHPMTYLLREGLADPPQPRRRGGRAGRQSSGVRD